MKKKLLENKNLPFIVFSSIFGALALSAIIVFWAFKDAEWVEVYQMALRWLVLPFCTFIASYYGTLKAAPKGLMWLCPVAFGLGISIVEWATYGSFSIVLLAVGALASLFGFTFAKMDRVEKAKEAKAAKIHAAMEAADVSESAAGAVNDEYVPHPDFIPDEDDTWADEIIAAEGFGEIKVDYAEPDPDFSIDAPDESENENNSEAEEEFTSNEESVKIDEAISDAADLDESTGELLSDSYEYANDEDSENGSKYTAEIDRVREDNGSEHCDNSSDDAASDTEAVTAEGVEDDDSQCALNDSCDQNDPDSVD